jgi:hypothetical protein
MESLARQLKRVGLITLMLLAALLLIDRIGVAHRFREAHQLPLDVSVAVVAALLACWLIPFRLRKLER